MFDQCSAVASPEYASDRVPARDVGRRISQTRQNRVDRVASDDDCFSSPAGSTANVSEAQMRRSQRRKDAGAALMRLSEIFLEDYGCELDSAARRDAANFLSNNFLVGMPRLSAESSGSILATWKTGVQSVVIRFIGGNQIDFSIAEEIGGTIVRSWGTTSFLGVLNDNPKALKIVRL